MKSDEGLSRLQLVKRGLMGGLPKRGRHVVSIEHLYEDPANERKTFGNMDDLVESIRRHGIIEPITVTQDGERFRILTGHRRFRAAKILGIPQVEVLVRESEDKTTRRFKSLVSNIQRENVGAIELAETLRHLIDSEAVSTQRELAQQIGKSEQWVSSMLRVLELPARLQERIRGATSIGYEMAQRITQIDDSAFQEELINAALAGESTHSIRQRIATRTGGEEGAHSKKRRSSTLVQFSHREGSCIATVKAKRGPEAREEIIGALRKLEQQVRSDEGLN